MVRGIMHEYRYGGDALGCWPDFDFATNLDERQIKLGSPQFFDSLF
jgi:hypothetical protein